MTISAEWLEWTRSHLRSGATVADTRDTLLEKGFSEKEVKYALKKLLPKDRYKRAIQSSAVRVASGSRGALPDYSQLAKPKLLRVESGRKVIPLGGDQLQLFAIQNVLSYSQCDALIEAISSDALPSKVDSYDRQSDMRSSRTCSLRVHEHPFIASINTTIANTLGLSNSWAEVTQGQWYEPGQQYKSHPDYFVPGTPEYDRFAKTHGQRTWTFMIYLNEPEAGGGTYFPKVNKTIAPKKGMAVCWNNLLESGEPNPNTVHAGLPVESGSKFIITKWFRDQGTGSPFVS